MNIKEHKTNKFFEIKKDEYLFMVNMKDIEERALWAYVLKWVNSDLRLLYRVELVSSNHIEEQLEAIADKFFKNKETLDHEGHSEEDIFHAMQEAKGRAS